MTTPPQLSGPASGLRPRPGSRRLAVFGVAAAMAGAIFVGDVITPLGADLGVLYVIPLLLTAFGGSGRTAIVAAIETSLLTLAGAVLSPSSVSAWAAMANRTIAIAVLWLAALILVRFQRTGLALDQRTKDLADISYAIDESAIVAITDVRGRITYVNDKFCEISRYSRDELIGRDHRIINSGYHPKEFMADLWQTIGSGRIWRGEIRNRAKDGSIYWVDTTIVPFLDGRGRPYQYMAIRYEVTDRKRSEEQLREQAALTKIGQMAAMIAHEVKNPIAGIRGALQVIISRMPADTRDGAIMLDIIARLDALNAIVGDILLFARPRQLKMARTDVAALITSTAELLRRDPAVADIEVSVAGGPAFVEADRGQLQIAVQNVLLNAAQAMGGRGRIDATITSEDGRCRIAVADQGPGMPDEVRVNAFEPFFTTKHRGTGLGLPIARRIVEGHGGEMQIDTPPGGGTIVTLVLPGGGSGVG